MHAHVCILKQIDGLHHQSKAHFKQLILQSRNIAARALLSKYVRHLATFSPENSVVAITLVSIARRDATFQLRIRIAAPSYLFGLIAALYIGSTAYKPVRYGSIL